ncbi:hypothetical protein J31TS6_32250 [Brevibacillus reuszeri]|uniref:hypothetical protein n=1 Tax=Brevibacillus reuszeri TaxID=54915 RepID=UPI001AFD1C29|nr:hypothetical protein [Brevibacillus reuszeri]GIO07197.1 hypothetical protein J31TS6_32250 [Brevibacillus reuszeri]
MRGYTEFRPIGIKTDYPHVDLMQKLVTARVVYEERVLMTVIIDVGKNTVQKEGSLAGGKTQMTNVCSCVMMNKKQGVI